MPKSAELGCRAGCSQGAVRLDESLALDDGRQIGVVGGIEERREDRRAERDGDELEQAQPTADIGDRDRGQEGSPAEVGPDEDGSATEPVDPRPSDEPEHECRTEVDGPDEGDLEGTGIEEQDRDERQRHPGDERPEDRDRRRRPDTDEGAVPPQLGSEGRPHDFGAYMAAERVIGDLTKGPAAVWQMMG